MDKWTFSDTNQWTSDLGYPPISFTNLSASLSGNGNALVVDSTNSAWLRFHVVEANGTNNLTVSLGSVMFWFAPNWASTSQGGTGPGVWGRLVESGSYTSNATYGWWSLYLDPAGTNLYFSAQTNNGAQATYLAAPISWKSNLWHQITLSYASTNSALYLDGSLLTNGSGVVYWPGANVLTNGFCIGSDNSGTLQAHGVFDDLITYNYQVDSATVSSAYVCDGIYFAGRMKRLTNSLSSLSTTPIFRVVSGSGSLQPVSTNLLNCLTSSQVWFTNVCATAHTNGTVDVTFTIAGGSDGLPYDVFANAILWPTSDTNYQWAWMGQGYHCVTYTLTNLSGGIGFLILGTPTDSDYDGLTDAYELLVSITDPNKTCSADDGIPDGWKVLWGISTSGQGGIASQDPDRDALTNFQEYSWGTRPQVAEGVSIWVGSPDSYSPIP